MEGGNYENTLKTPQEIEEIETRKYKETLEKEELEKMTALTEKEKEVKRNAEQFKLNLN